MLRRHLLALTAGLMLAACGGNVDTPSSLGPDLSRIHVIRVETRVAQNGDIYYADAEARANIDRRREADEPNNPIYETERQREARMREKIRASAHEAIVKALRGLPAGDLPVVAEVLITRYRIRTLLRGALLGSDHEAEATLTLRHAVTGEPVSEPLQIRAESSEQVAILGGLALRAIRPSPETRLNANLAAEIRAALDRVTVTAR